MSNVKEIANSAYAFLLVKYISELGDPHRYLVLGFRDIMKDLTMHFKTICGGNLVKPTGKLQEISSLRKTLSPCLIALDWDDVGKYASWTTSFKILAENPLNMVKSGNLDVHDPTDVILWLSKRNDILDQILELMSKKLETTKLAEVEPLKCLLARAHLSIQRSRSYAEWFHPRRIVEALTLMVQRHSTHEDPTFGDFLRKIGMEPSTEFCDIPFFSNNLVDEKALKKFLRNYQQVLRNYLIGPYEKGGGKLRKSLAILGVNLLRHLLIDAAQKEIEEGKHKPGKWTAYFLEFEQGKREKRTRRRKYDVNVYGTTIIQTSSISGLPTQIQFILKRSKDFDGDNILLEFLNGELDVLFAKSKGNAELNFSLTAIEMLRKDELIMNLKMEKDGNLIIDPYVKGLKAPSRKINKLLSTLGAE